MTGEPFVDTITTVSHAMKKLSELPLETSQLPSLPSLVNELEQLIGRNEDLNVIADLLATDTSLTARVIELANSAFYGSSSITRIFDAVHLIGLNKIILFVRTAYTIEILKSIKGITIDMAVFWKRSYIAALTAQSLANRINYPQGDTLYTTGLLMYIGQLILTLLPQDMDTEALKHHEIAAAQLSIWGFPDVFVEAIHHLSLPSESSDQYALPASLIHMTDCIISNTIDQLDPDALVISQLSEQDIIDIINSDIYEQSIRAIKGN